MPRAETILLGDSITMGLRMKGAANWGLSGRTATELVQWLHEHPLGERRVFLLIGVNDLIRGLPLDAALSSLSYLLPRNLVWSGIMPTDRVAPERIERANATIRRLCAGRARFVDTSFMQPHHFRDGLHPNEAGYAAWLHQTRITSTK